MRKSNVHAVDWKLARLFKSRNGPVVVEAVPEPFLDAWRYRTPGSRENGLLISGQRFYQEFKEVTFE